MSGQLEEHVFQRHGNGFQFEQSPSTGDRQASHFFPHVPTKFAFQEIGTGGAAREDVLDPGPVKDSTYSPCSFPAMDQSLRLTSSRI